MLVARSNHRVKKLKNATDDSRPTTKEKRGSSFPIYRHIPIRLLVMALVTRDIKWSFIQPRLVKRHGNNKNCIITDNFYRQFEFGTFFNRPTTDRSDNWNTPVQPCNYRSSGISRPILLRVRIRGRWHATPGRGTEEEKVYFQAGEERMRGGFRPSLSFTKTNPLC